jgi:hypothetical protein
MRRSAVLGGFLAAILAGRAAAQSSEFGIRGLGIPGRAASAHSIGLEGSNSMFDAESSSNAAALVGLSIATSAVSSLNSSRTSSDPSGSSSARDARFPQLMVGGPAIGPLFVGVSYSIYTDRDFTVVSSGTAAPRDSVIAVHDTLSSRGGIDDIRLGAAWKVGPHLAVGAAFHFLTGSNRLASRRYWEDTVYQAPRQTAELSYRANGFSLGVMWQPLPTLGVAASVRHDGRLQVQRDSTGAGAVAQSYVVGNTRLPTTLSAALRYRPDPRFVLSTQVIRRNWSVADSGIVAQGGVGARSTIDLSAGVEYFRNAAHPSRLPLRLGVRHATLPFLLVSGSQPSEFDLSIGTGFRFAADRGGFDLALERVRRSQGSAYTESGWQVSIGISVRAGGVTP